jgi:hypothetical protein
MTHVLESLARDRQRTLLAAAADERDALRARRHGRTFRQAARTERRQFRSQVSALRADLRKLESAAEPNLESAGEPR